MKYILQFVQRVMRPTSMGPTMGVVVFTNPHPRCITRCSSVNPQLLRAGNATLIRAIHSVSSDAWLALMIELGHVARTFDQLILAMNTDAWLALAIKLDVWLTLAIEL